MNEGETWLTAWVIAGLLLLSLIICVTFYSVNVPSVKIECSGLQACHEIMEKLNK